MDSLTAFENPEKIALKRLRIAAATLDFTLLAAIGLVLGFFWGERVQDSEGVGLRLKGWPAFIWFLTWLILVQIKEGTSGQTFGKKFIKIKVVKKNLNPTNIGTSLLRHLFDGIDCFLFMGLLVAGLNKRKQRIGDLLAGTLVVHEG